MHFQTCRCILRTLYSLQRVAIDTLLPDLV